MQDLKMSQEMRSTPLWYQDPWVVVGLSFIAFGTGYFIGSPK